MGDDQKTKKRRLRDYSKEKAKERKCKLQKKLKKWEEKRKKKRRIIQAIPRCMIGPPVHDDSDSSDDELITFELRRPVGFLLDSEKDVPSTPTKPVSILRNSVNRTRSLDVSSLETPTLFSPVRSQVKRSVSDETFGGIARRRKSIVSSSAPNSPANGILSPPTRMSRRASLGGMQFSLHDNDGISRRAGKRPSIEGNLEDVNKDIENAARYFESRNGETEKTSEDSQVLLALHAELRKAAANRTGQSREGRETSMRRRRSIDPSGTNIEETGLMSPIKRGQMKRRKSLREAVLSNSTHGKRSLDMNLEELDSDIDSDVEDVPKMLPETPVPTETQEEPTHREPVARSASSSESKRSTQSDSSAFDSDYSKRSSRTVETSNTSSAGSCPTTPSESPRRKISSKISAIFEKFEQAASPAKTVRKVAQSPRSLPKLNATKSPVPLDASLSNLGDYARGHRSPNARFGGFQGRDFALPKPSTPSSEPKSDDGVKERKQIAVVPPSLASIEKPIEDDTKYDQKKKSKKHDKKEKSKHKKSKEGGKDGSKHSKKSKSDKEKSSKKPKSSDKEEKKSKKEKKKDKAPTTPRSSLSDARPVTPTHSKSPTSVMDMMQEFDYPAVECAPEVTPEMTPEKPEVYNERPDGVHFSPEYEVKPKVGATLRSSKVQDLIRQMGIQ